DLSRSKAPTPMVGGGSTSANVRTVTRLSRRRYTWNGRCLRRPSGIHHYFQRPIGRCSWPIPAHRRWADEGLPRRCFQHREADDFLASTVNDKAIVAQLAVR